MPAAGRELHARASLVLALAAAVAIACGDDGLKLCGTIPEGGCPIGRGGTCDDATCVALYDCVDGQWTLTKTCAASTGGGGAGGGMGQGGAGGGGTGGCETVQFDHSNEATDCMPDLRSPDCPAVAGEVCNPCLTDCSDFYLCEPRGWTPVGFCNDQGELIVEQSP